MARPKKSGFMITATASSATRTSFAILHIVGAATHYRAAAKVEAREAGKKFSSEAHVEHQAGVVGSVLQSAAAVEAMVNEFFLDCETNEKSIAHLRVDEREAVVAAWHAGADKLSALEKTALLLALLRRPPMERGKRTYQEGVLLFKLRNALMHAKAEWVTTMTSHPGKQPSRQPLEAQCRGKFSDSPFSGPGNAFFPSRMLSADCAKWAVRAAVVYMDEVFRRVGSKATYEHVRSQLP